MIKTELYEQALFETIKRGATEISDDVRIAFEKAIARESNADTKRGLQATLDSMNMSKIRENPLCVDTGWPIFYFKVGNNCELEGGFVELENAARRAVARATELGYLRATMKHPLTDYDPGNNIGINMAEFHLCGPLTDPDVEQLSIGDIVYISGAAFTCRSRLQKYIFDENNVLPFSTEGRNIMIHNGPIVVKENGKWRLVSFMPTSSIRFEKWGAKSVENWNLNLK